MVKILLYFLKNHLRTVKWKNVVKALRGQGPLKRAFKNFFITGNAWGMFHINSHIVHKTGKSKVMYNTPETAKKSALSMSKKQGVHFSAYKCVFCDGYHLGKNRFAKDNNIYNI